MTRFVQLHILTAYGAANLNRDDTGRPKTLTFGGAERLRISSQSLKRAFRESEAFATTLAGAIGSRSQRFMGELIAGLEARGLSREDAVARAGVVVTDNKLGKLKGEAQTEQLVHLGPDELARIAALVDELVADPSLKGPPVLSEKPRAADIAMFGRMLADNTRHNVEAAVQVAHAFTTHRVAVEDDYYTAVDDLKDPDIDAGAGFIGVQYYGAGLFYLYVCIDADLLLANLSGERSLAADTIEALIRAACTVGPTGKQNAFASRAKALYVLQEIGEDAPRSLAAAFQHPVGARRGEADPQAASIERLGSLRAGYAQAYGEAFATQELDVAAGKGSLADLIAAARALYAG
ncbi:type I-E CRISPR-associated protein Cas7/Cse4/CasC [Phenylobacterium sp.]|uniref:type I-E CRISPR-associated protein Cas7/Cse4/CasC n=1 Tax=Phenylobacterium sp. TaxID=1871053 RepID=UPI00301C79F3